MVEGEAKGRGYEYAKNAYIPVDDDELDALAVESKHTIEIDAFVPREQIDERYLDSPYYITPGRPSRAGRICGDPRGHARQGHGCARSCRAGKTRARHHARALEQGADGHHAPLSLRDQGREGVLQRHS